VREGIPGAGVGSGAGVLHTGYRSPDKKAPRSTPDQLTCTSPIIFNT
jgi:hypothetical protein